MRQEFLVCLCASLLLSPPCRLMLLLSQFCLSSSGMCLSLLNSKGARDQLLRLVRMHPACLHALQLDSTRTVTDEARFLGTLVRCTDQAQLKVAEGFQPGMFIPGISRRSREPWPASSTAWRLDFGCPVQPMGGSVLDAFLGGRWSYVFRKSRWKIVSSRWTP